jgi:hypothetical protein
MKTFLDLFGYQKGNPMKIWLLFFLVFCPGFLVRAQFGPQQILDPNVYVSKIVTADLDNNGFPDIITSRKEFNNSKISLYLNSGSANFAPEAVLTANVNDPEGIAAGDLDGNGWNDIVAISYNPNKLIWFPNTSGVFSTEILLDTNMVFPEDVEIVDMDNDGNLDIVVLGHVNIIIHYNNGNSTFTKTTVPNNQFEYYAFSIADLDGDGFKDIVIGSSEVLVYMNDNGSFTSHDIARSNSIVNPGLCFMAHTADLDGNGSMDLVIDGNANSEINWHANDGNGFFTLMQTIENTAQCESVSTADFNNDGSLDLFASLLQEGEVVWYSNNGQGVFGSKQWISDGNAPSTVVTATADLNNDGNTDVIWAHPFSFNLNNHPMGLESHLNPGISIKVSPNPFEGQLFIHAQEQSILNVFDLQGRLLYQNIPIEAGICNFSKTLPPQQVYFFEFTTPSRTIVKKIVKK